jgi:predicted membrane channel-forming protein YqfA (hemolysin III family)
MLLITVGVIALVFAHWGLTAKDALDRGIFNFDSLWYHMPFAVEMAQSHSVTGLHYTETVFTNWFYPQNSEILHAAGILLTERDTLSLFLNFGWLAVVFLAAWCIGRPYGRGHLSVIAVALLLECHTLVVREPGAAKNDLVAAGLLLAAIAILINAWATSRQGEQRSLPVGWALAAAGLAVGLAVGTKSTTLAIVVAITVAVLVLAPAGRRWAAAGWWFLPAIAGGGFWYLRNLIVAGNPQPQVESLGPISLPHPEQLQTGRPDFSIAHYATDTGVWREYFGPGLEQAFGTLWPLVVAGAIAGAVLALLRGRDRVVRWSGGVVLVGMLVYLITPLSASGAEGAPVGFALNIRYAIPALLAGMALLPLARVFDGERRQWVLIAVLLVVLVATDRADAVLRDPSRFFGLLVATLSVLIPAALLLARSRGASRSAVAAGFAILALSVATIGYPVQRDYLHNRFGPGAGIPDMDLDSAYLWARDVDNARIGLAGTTAGFLQYGFYGRDLSNQVVYLGASGPHGAFNPIPTCREFRAAVNAADLDYLVTAPFLNFIHTEEPIASPEAGWLQGDPAVTPFERSGPVIIWRVGGRLRPATCDAQNAPLRRVPYLPSA